VAVGGGGSTRGRLHPQDNTITTKQNNSLFIGGEYYQTDQLRYPLFFALRNFVTAFLIALFFAHCTKRELGSAAISSSSCRVLQRNARRVT